MAKWAELELTPERWQQYLDEAEQALVKDVHPDTTPPWED